MTTHRTRARTAVAAGLLGLSTLLLSACGSGASGATAAGSASSASARGAAMQAYRTCLTRHGVTLPSGRPSVRPSGGYPGGSGGGFGGGAFGGGAFGGASPNPTVRAAMQACASLRPKGGFGGGGRGGFNSSAMAAFAGCMKDHGVTLPPNGGFRALNTADAKTAAAYTTCKPLLPTRGPGPSPSASA